jgi:hypothetical protein
MGTQVGGEFGFFGFPSEVVSVSAREIDEKSSEASILSEIHRLMGPG